MAGSWIDFTELKRRVPIRSVLERYGYLSGLVEKKPGKLVGPCPIHGGKGKSSFHADTNKNIFNCFSQCGGGNVLDLVMRIEECEIREAGEKLCAWFELTFERGNGVRSSTRNSAKVSQKTKPKKGSASRSEAASGKDSPVVNPPLDRPLKNLNQDHPYLVRRGLAVPTIKAFGVGHCVRGLMQGRIAIPIHDADGQLVAYAGRAIDEERAEKDGKYKLPPNFTKSAVLFNLHRAIEHGPELIVVEGFFDCMKVHQAGFQNVVALMGSTLTEEQEELLLEHTERLVLMFDGDEAGKGCLRQCFLRLAHKTFLKRVMLEDGEQPDNLTVERICELLSQS